MESFTFRLTLEHLWQFGWRREFSCGHNTNWSYSYMEMSGRYCRKCHKYRMQAFNYYVLTGEPTMRAWMDASEDDPSYLDFGDEPNGPL
jgi:hypothetical protein